MPGQEASRRDGDAAAASEARASAAEEEQARLASALDGIADERDAAQALCRQTEEVLQAQVGELRAEADASAARHQKEVHLHRLSDICVYVELQKISDVCRYVDTMTRFSSVPPPAPAPDLHLGGVAKRRPLLQIRRLKLTPITRVCLTESVHKVVW